MRNVHIKDFCKQKTQQEIAKILGTTQGAVSKAIRVNRDIYFTEHQDGTYTYFEIKTPNFSRSKAKS